MQLSICTVSGKKYVSRSGDYINSYVYLYEY